MVPDVFDYADFRLFLRDWLEARKASNPALSQRFFARRLGTQDPSALTNVISGRRRLSPGRTKALLAMLELDAPSAAYFGALVDFAQARGPGQRDRGYAALAELRSRHLPPGVDDTKFAFLSRWVLPAIRELAYRRDFSEDPAWIARQLDPEVSPEAAAAALAAVVEMGFLVRTADGLRPAEPTVRTSETVQMLASYPYHRDVQGLAARALQRLYEGSDPRLKDDSAFLGCTLAVPQHRIPEIRAALFEMQARVAAMTEGWQGEADRVVQVTIAVFPVSVGPTG